jgi:hypothetical protein
MKVGRVNEIDAAEEWLDSWVAQVNAQAERTSRCPAECRR